VEVIADASLAFVGNIDQSVEQIVNSTEYDLFQPLPPQFDLAVMDRLACYLPGWEMPKNSSEFLTGNYGLITDYLAEAYHYQLKHTNRYEEVSKRIRLGSSVEGRDEKGIKKTVSALLKILHPDGPPGDAEFNEYVEYAIECRRRIKEQMNKRKPDDEFARINLSYYRADGAEVTVFCPESKAAVATQQPFRRHLGSESAETEGAATAESAVPPGAVRAAPTAPEMPVEPVATVEPEVERPPELTAKHLTIRYNDTGHTYESLFGAYLIGAKRVVVEDPYIRLQHQIQNFVRLCELLVRTGTVRQIQLVTGYEDSNQKTDIAEKLSDLSESLRDVDIELTLDFNPRLHDRAIMLDNGWAIKIGRGLDIYQKPQSWFELGANDVSLRRCLETNVDVYRQ
jgi:ATP-dependent Lon protease